MIYGMLVSLSMSSRFKSPVYTFLHRTLNLAVNLRTGPFGLFDVHGSDEMWTLVFPAAAAKLSCDRGMQVRSF